MGTGNCARGKFKPSRVNVCLSGISNTDIYPATAANCFPNTFEEEAKFLAPPLSQQEMLINLDSNMTQFGDYSSCQNSWWSSLLEV